MIFPCTLRDQSLEIVGCSNKPIEDASVFRPLASVRPGTDFLRRSDATLQRLLHSRAHDSFKDGRLEQREDSFLMVSL